MVVYKPSVPWDGPCRNSLYFSEELPTEKLWYSWYFVIPPASVMLTYRVTWSVLVSWWITSFPEPKCYDRSRLYLRLMGFSVSTFHGSTLAEGLYHKDIHLYIFSETNRLPKNFYQRTLNLANKMIPQCMMRFNIQNNKQYVSTQKLRFFRARNIYFFNKIVFIYKTLFSVSAWLMLPI